MNLQTWLTISIIISALLVNRPLVLVGLSLILWTAVPSVAGHHLTGMEIATGTPVPPVHPVTILAGIAVLIQVLFRGPTTVAGLRRQPGVVTALGLAVLSAIGQTVYLGSPNGTALMLDQLAGGLLLYSLVLIAGETATSPVEKLSRLWLSLAALEGIVGLLVKSDLLRQPFETDFRTTVWYSLDSGRQSATLDHPLALALFCVTAVPLLVYVRSSVLQLVLLAGITSGVVVSQSRTGLLLLVAGILYLVLASSQGVGRKFVVAVATIAGGFYVAGTAFFAQAQGRFVQDTGSAAARSLARSTFASNWERFAVFGDGSGSSYLFARNEGLVTSLENGWLMYAVDFGVVTTLILIIALVRPALSAGRRRSAPTFALLMAVLGIASYSSIATDTIAGPVLFLVAGMAAVVARQIASGEAIAPSPPGVATEAHPLVNL